MGIISEVFGVVKFNSDIYFGYHENCGVYGGGRGGGSTTFFYSFKTGIVSRVFGIVEFDFNIVFQLS